MQVAAHPTDCDNHENESTLYQKLLEGEYHHSLRTAALDIQTQPGSVWCLISREF